MNTEFDVLVADLQLLGATGRAATEAGTAQEVC